MHIKGQRFIYSIKIQHLTQFYKERAILLVISEINKFSYQPCHNCQFDFISKKKKLSFSSSRMQLPSLTKNNLTFSIPVMEVQA